MKRYNLFELKPNKKQRAILKECMLLSSCIYNMANYIVRQQLFNQEKVSSFLDLQQRLQNTNDYKSLGRVYALPRLQVYGETTSTRFKLIKSKTQKKVGLPKYLKNRKTNTTIPSYLVMDNCQYHLGKNKVMIPLSRVMRKKYNIKYFAINYNGTMRWIGKQCRGQIRSKDGKFYLHQSVEVETPVLKSGGNVAALDLGIKNLLTFIAGSEEKIYGRTRFYKQWLYYVSSIAKEQTRLAKESKVSSKRLSKFYKQRNIWQENLYKNLVSKMFRVLKRNNVSTLIAGDVTHILEDNDKGKVLNQMMHNYWSFDKLMHRIENKAEENGIELIKETEEYTSRTCPICGDDSKSNCKDRIFLCNFCGYIDHRDINGARNIMLKSMYGSIEKHTSGRDSPFIGADIMSTDKNPIIR